MSPFKSFMPWMMWVFLVSCISQTPSELKSNSQPLRPNEAACSSVVFEGEILTKKNVQHIFECTGWAKSYPDLFRAIVNSNEDSFNHSFKVINENLFSTKSKRQTFFKLLIDLESQGQLDVLAKMIELSLQEHNIFTQLNQILESVQIGSDHRTTLMKVLSKKPEENIKNLKMLRNFLEKYEIYKPDVSKIFEESDHPRINQRLIIILDELFSKPNKQDWDLLSEILQGNVVNLHDWFLSSSQNSVDTLLNIITDHKFITDIVFLKKSLNEGIVCKNFANEKNFHISVSKELKHKIEALKFGPKDEVANHLLHGMTKYLAFQEFCLEKNQKQGLDSFIRILRHIYGLLSSDHDYQLIKSLHVLFRADHYKLIDFLSTATFSEVTEELKLLRKKDQHDVLVTLMHQWLSEINPDDLRNLSEITKDLSDDQSRFSMWYQAWSSLWPLLTVEQKQQIVKFIKIFFSDELESSKAIDSLIKLFQEFPNLTSGLADALDDQKYQIDLRYLIATLSTGAVQKDMSHFLSNKGLFDLMRILTKESESQFQNKSLTPKESNSLVLEKSYVLKSFTDKKKVCFDRLYTDYLKRPDYYFLVNTLPDECKASLGQTGFVGQIYLWMNLSNNFFESRGIKDYHTGTGVWAPHMLHFLFSSALLADHQLVSTNGKRGIRNNIDEIHRVLTQDDFLEVFHRFSKLIFHVDQKINFSKNFSSYIQINDDKHFEKLIRDSFELSMDITPIRYSPHKDILCAQLDANLGADPCLKDEEIEKKSIQILRILKRKNEQDSSLMKELLAWMHPESVLKNHTSIEEVIRFLHDLSSDATKKSFIYRDASGKKISTGTALDRLEVLIRDIGFLNNYFGSYFKNEVASASNYRNYLISSKKTMVLLDVSSPALRSLKGLPKESAWKLKNVRNTYDSLIEISDEYQQPDGTQKRYDHFIQGLLQSIVRSSKLSTQDFNPYQFPRAEKVEGHNGSFLTHLVEMSALRYLSLAVRSYISNDLHELKNPLFQMVNNNLIRRFELNSIQAHAQDLLDKYLDNDQNQINQIMRDLIELNSQLNADEKELIRNIGFKLLILISNKDIDQKNIKEFTSFIEPLIKYWPQIYPLIKSTPNKAQLLRKLNDFLDMLNQRPVLTNQLLNELIGLRIINSENIHRLFSDQEFLVKLFDFLTLEMDFDSDLNWKETFKAVLAGEHFKFQAMKLWLQDSLNAEDKKLSLTLLISVLGEKNGNDYRLKFILDELFLNHRTRLEQFLDQTFSALEFKTD
jgi:hypothetical protein